jgi:hypothetical protein
MIRTILSIAAAAALIPAAARAQTPLDPCTLLTPDQIKAILNSPVEPGQPGVTKNSHECTWSTAQGEDRLYIALKPAADFRTIRTQIEKSGAHPSPVTGLGDDAFFISDESSSALYVLSKNHFLLLTVTLPPEGAQQAATQQANQTAEKTLATQILPKL